MRKTKEFYRGCLVGGAVGDALGWSVQFMDLNKIKSKFGEAGLCDINIGVKGTAEISDETQLTLFTAEGLLRYECKKWNKGVASLKEELFLAYLRWVYTQTGYINSELSESYNGYLISKTDLYARRYPSRDTIRTLKKININNLDEDLNITKGCGAVMRVAPIGLFYNTSLSFQKGIDCGRITHGHKRGYICAGIMSYIISAIISDASIIEAIKESINELKKTNLDNELACNIEKVLEISNNSKKNDEKIIESFGRGFTAEEALSIAIYCSIKYGDNFEKAVLKAANHSGNSNTAASLTGNIVGAYLGEKSIPKKWKTKLELSDVLKEISDDLLIGYSDEGNWWTKYPYNYF